MTQYPSAEEIKQIVARRKQLSQELMGCLMLGRVISDCGQIKQRVREPQEAFF